MKQSPCMNTALLVILLSTLISAAPNPLPVPNSTSQGRRAMPTMAPRSSHSISQLRAVLDFYDPSEEFSQGRANPSAQRRQQQRNPTFPSQYPSCYNCQQKYSSLSSCMEASSVFENATSIFNSPWSYISVLKCSCTDTFQSVFPQCVECFQLTNQCQYLGTDSAGTGAYQIVSNVRSICAFASSVLGKAQSANYPIYNFTYTPSVVPSYTDVTSQGPGYNDQATGAIFSSGSIVGYNTCESLLVVCFALAIAILVIM